MKLNAGILVGLALVVAAGLGSPGARASDRAVSHAVAVVTTTADVVNGDVSSIAALNAHPGRDGISLREALEAADATRGAETVYVMFSHRLNGKTIELRSALPPIRRSHLVLEGIAPNGSAARITLDGRRARPLPGQGVGVPELLLIQASEVTVRWLRFTGLRPNKASGREPAVLVQPGPTGGYPPGPRTIADVAITDDAFDNSGTAPPGPGEPSANGLIVGAFFGGRGEIGTHITGVTVARDTFLDYTADDALGVWADYSGATVTGVVIEDNNFDRDKYSIELSEGGNAPRQTGAQIVGNNIKAGNNIKGSIGISVNTTNATDGRISGTLIEDNAISGVDGAAINLGAGEFDPGMGGRDGGDVIASTQIVNNVIRTDCACDAGIYMSGGGRTTSPPSHVSSVTVENDTLAEDASSGFLLDLVSEKGNSVTAVTVRNTILYELSGSSPIAEGGPGNERPPDVLMNSLISGPGWAGRNGNITGDPDFAGEAAGDYRLAAGSPCINAGTTVGAPVYDFGGARRDSKPDIGAFEYGAVPRPLLTVTLEPLGGNGTVTSSPPGIRCGTTCGARFDPGTTITLTAKAARQSRFLGWHGACSGTRRCVVAVRRAKSVYARFAP